MVIKVTYEDPRNLLEEIKRVREEIHQTEEEIANFQKKIEDSGFIFRESTLTSEDYFQKVESKDPSELIEILEKLQSYKDRLSHYKDELFLVAGVIEAFGNETLPGEITRLCKEKEILAFLNKVFLVAGIEFFRKTGFQQDDWQRGALMVKIIIRLYENGLKELFDAFLLNYFLVKSESGEEKRGFVGLLDSLYRILSGKESGYYSRPIPRFDPERLIRSLERILIEEKSNDGASAEESGKDLSGEQEKEES